MIQQSEEGKQEEPVAAAGSVAGIHPVAGRSRPVGPGSQAAAGRMLLAGSSCFGCN